MLCNSTQFQLNNDSITFCFIFISLFLVVAMPHNKDQHIELLPQNLLIVSLRLVQCILDQIHQQSRICITQLYNTANVFSIRFRTLLIQFYLQCNTFTDTPSHAHWAHTHTDLFAIYFTDYPFHLQNIGDVPTLNSFHTIQLAYRMVEFNMFFCHYIYA